MLRRPRPSGCLDSAKLDCRLDISTERVAIDRKSGHYSVPIDERGLPAQMDNTITDATSLFEELK
ncbi:hypothetical protein [Halovenus sp. HT40]|uniref:hypothetical protein n=1 Tax=Halovenus sp. HT40 TaxID=3126691 RepID=UPI00300F6D9F